MRAESVAPVVATDVPGLPAPVEVTELVARACPRLVLDRVDNSTLRDLVRDCDRELERKAQPGRACEPDRDGLCVK